MNRLSFTRPSTKPDGWTPATPGLPFVTAYDTDEATIGIMRQALDRIANAPDHAWIRDALLLDGFAEVPQADYDQVLALERRAIALGYPELA